MDRTGLIILNKLKKLYEKEVELFNDYWDNKLPGSSLELSHEEFHQKFANNFQEYFDILNEIFFGKKFILEDGFIDGIEGFKDGWLVRNSKTKEFEFGLSIIGDHCHSYTGFPVIRIIPKPFRYQNSYRGLNMQSEEFNKKYHLHPVFNFEVRKDLFFENYEKLEDEKKLLLELMLGDLNQYFVKPLE